MMKKNNLTFIQFVGSLLILVGAALKFFVFDFSNYIFAAGALILIALQFFYLFQSKNQDFRTQRLHRLMFLATALLGVGAYFMFTGKNTWIPLLLSYALVSLFLSFRSKTPNS
ncbi:conserved membrane hypothetical protein [uncultured Paludibacter sp.]|nr:conserved membrane hypothetical protein [uncultured Paludibacter sp.]